MYTHGDLFSHIIGQVDYENNGISGVEKFFDNEEGHKEIDNLEHHSYL